ncbi:isoleucine--tRNA ligase [Kitasatospora sp. NPDC058063]|uniref:isoleucine--tRNA ligase n=1 Tax=unclassified Kitasatospora TaxID=2633591 RepID=UPI0036DE41A5
MSAPLNLPSLEEEVIGRWQRDRIPAAFAARNPKGKPWVTFEGPPTVNGAPALHHVWTSTYKDVYGRFQIMRGRRVERKGGWDCQGLPVEIAVERALGLKNKRDIERYGIGEFVEKCRELVEKNISSFEEVFSRIGYWADYENAYRTMDDSFLESVWWQIKQMWRQDLLFEGQKVVPYCVRCATGLSSHELGQPGVYRDVTHDSLFVGMPLDDGEEQLAVWTTTPWTLPANVAVAVDPQASYGRFRLADGRTVIAGVAQAERALPGAELLAEFPGSELVGCGYRRPYPEVELTGGRGGVVIAWNEVAGDVGTGLVHIAPAFGEEDNALGVREGLAVLSPIDGNGEFQVGPFAGRSVQDVSADVAADLADKGLLLRTLPYQHQYPHCWRCGSELIYWAKPNWFIRTSSRRAELMAQNESVTWHPGHLKDGRFGNWLKENVDWAMSRDRFWGTPVPIWRCSEGHATCVGSRAELTELTGHDQSELSLHRPAIDEVSFPCPECGERATRVTAVCDVWLDSGCVPAAQWGYPAVETESFERNFPADFVCEAIDQTRGWFYSLLAANTTVFGTSPYRTVVCLGHLVDDDGRKMSKSIGNVIDPLALLPEYGADGIRWYLLSAGTPWGARRISFEAIEQRIRRDLDTLWNVVSFHARYAELEGFTRTEGFVSEHLMDRWVASRLLGLTRDVTADMEGYAAHLAVKRIGEFIDELSNWYVRRSRRRFWEGDQAALETLAQVLETLAVLLAPFCPHLAEAVHHQLRGPEGGSVHLADWPVEADRQVDEALESQMAEARQVSSLARAARRDFGIAGRQPLRTAVLAGVHDWSEAITEIALDELNVRRLLVGESSELPISHRLKANWKALGPRHRGLVSEIARAIGELTDPEAVAALRAGRSIELSVAGATVTVAPDEVTVEEVLLGGWQLAADNGITVAMETTIDEELAREGRQRTVVRHIQVARRAAGLEIQDRIRLWLDRELLAGSELVAREVLAELVEPLDLAPSAESGAVHGEGFVFHAV